MSPWFQVKGVSSGKRENLTIYCSLIEGVEGQRRVGPYESLISQGLET